MPPPTEHITTPSPEQTPSIVVDNIVFGGQIYPVEEIYNNSKYEGRRKFLYTGKPRPVILMESVGVSAKAEGDSLAAQIIFAYKLQQLGLTATTVILGCCTLQRHTRKIKKLTDLTKIIAQQIKTIWIELDKSNVSAEALKTINTAIEHLLKKKFQEEPRTQREIILELIERLHTNFTSILPNFNTVTLNKYINQIKKLIALTNREDFLSLISNESVKQTLRVGNDWQKKTEELIKIHLNEAVMPTMRWPDIFNFENSELQGCKEYKDLLSLKKTTTTKIDDLIKKMLFPSLQIKISYLEKIKKYHNENTQNCKQSFDDTVTEYLLNNDLKNSWQNTIGYSEQESRQACLEYLFEECAWLAYIAENHPDILIFYPGPVSLAIEWTFKFFHPKQEVCWLSIITTRNKLEENHSMKPIEKTHSNKEQAPSPKETIQIEFNGLKITLPKGEPKEIEDMVKAVRNGLGLQTPEYPQQRSSYLPCVIL